MENLPEQKPEPQPQAKEIVKICTRCGCKRRPEQFKDKKNGEPYKTCVICQAKQQTSQQVQPVVVLNKQAETPTTAPAPAVAAKDAPTSERIEPDAPSSEGIEPEREPPPKRKVKIPKMKGLQKKSTALVEIIHSTEDDDGEEDSGGFFKPLLFAAIGVAIGAAINKQPQNV